MIGKAIIRNLEKEDALVSWQWRNDPEVWALTGSSPDKFITYEIEKNWIEQVLNRENEKRFAICIGNNEKTYIGNGQLTDITMVQAQFHIFIGDKNYWKKGIATEAARLIIEYGFNELKLQYIYLFVKKDNIAAIKLYKKCGFKVCSDEGTNFKMVIKHE